MDFQRCSQDTRRPLLVVEEHKRKFTLQNPQGKHVKQIQVDGCLIQDKRPRCDYLFEIGQVCQCVIYVELKGKDVEHAFRQLVATMGYMTQRHQPVKKICQIVASRVPRAGPKVQNLQLIMARKYNAQLYVDTQEAAMNVERA